MNPIMKTAMALGVAGALTLAAATPSMARSRHFGPALGAGIVAGALLGAVAANANAQYYYDTGPYAYAPGPVYDTYAAGPYYDNDIYGAPRYYRSYRNNGPAHEDHLTGTGAGFVN